MKHIDFAPLRAVEVLPDHFLNDCSSLEKLDLSPLVNLREVGHYFLRGCISMKSIDLTPLRAVEVLAKGFLRGCSLLEEVDLSPLVNVRVVGSYFLSGCTGLKYIDLSSLRAIEALPWGLRLPDESEMCLQDCPNLKAIRLAPRQPASLLPSNLRELIVR